MAKLLGGLTRHVVGDRRRDRRQRRKHDTIVRNEKGKEIFRGRSVDVSKSGAKLVGFPCCTGVYEGQEVRIDFVIVPRDYSKVAKRVPVLGYISRFDEQNDQFVLGVKFHQSMSQN